jgi:hypothetical protein
MASHFFSLVEWTDALGIQPLNGFGSKSESLQVQEEPSICLLSPWINLFPTMIQLNVVWYPSLTVMY